MSNPVSRAIAGAAMQALSGEQKTRLVLLAREAFDHLVDRGELGDAAEPDVWRREQCMQVVERAGLTACRNEDYLPLRAHFLRILGREQVAEIAAQRAWEDPRRQALAKLRQECEAAADVMPQAGVYAAGFLRNKRHVGIEDADTKSLWHAVFVVRRRAAQLRRSS